MKKYNYCISYIYVKDDGLSIVYGHTVLEMPKLTKENFNSMVEHIKNVNKCENAPTIMGIYKLGKRKWKNDVQNADTLKL